MATLNSCFTTHGASDADIEMFTKLSKMHGEAGGLEKHLETLDTEEQQLRDALNLKDFIGDSTVIEEDGSPRVVFHATRADFEAFEVGDLGYHFGTAEQANERLRTTRRDKGAEGENILNVVIRLENPAILEDVGDWRNPINVAKGMMGAGFEDAAELYDEALELGQSFEDGDAWVESSEAADLIDDLRTILIDNGHDGVQYANQVENKYGSSAGLTDDAQTRVDTLNARIQEIQRQVVDRRKPIPENATTEDVQAFIDQPDPKATPEEQAEIDSIHDEREQVLDEGENDTNSFIVFDANQIKSVQNKGTFDKADPLILNQAKELGIDEGAPAPTATEPVETVKAYKLFRIDPQRPGQLFPLFVDANTPVSLGEWVDAQIGEQGTNTKTGKTQVKSKIGGLAMRPGWHAGDLPVATHIGGKTSGTKPDYRPANQVWAEVEMPADVDWQAEANSRATISKSGKPVASTAHITDQVPAGGHYRYKTNPNMTGEWMIGGSMRVTRVLDAGEVQAINDEAGVADLPRLEGEIDPVAYFKTDVELEASVNQARDELSKLNTKITSKTTDIKKLTTGISPKEAKTAEKEGREPTQDLELGTEEQIKKAKEQLKALNKQLPAAEALVPKRELDALPARRKRSEARASEGPFTPIPGVDTSVGGGLTERSHIHIADLEGAYVIPIYADLTATGVTFDSLDGIPITPTSYFGGPNFSWLQQYREDGIVWAFNAQGVITGLKNHVANLRQKMIDEGLPPRVVITVQAMSQEAHLSNSMVSGALLKTLDGMVKAKQITKKAAASGNKIIAKKAKNSEDGSAELATFPSLADAAAVHKWLTKTSTFTGRKALSKAIATAEFGQIEGMFPVGRVIREAIDKDFRGTQTGDTVLAFEIDPSDPDLLVDFENPLQNVRNVDTHPSYKVGMRGKLLGTMSTTIPQSIMYKDAIDHRRSLGAEGESKFLLERLPNGENPAKPVEGQLITPELVAEAQLVEDIGDYRVAQAYSSIFAGEWSSSAVPVTEGGVSPAEAERAIEESAGRPLLSALSRKQVEKGAKDGSLTVHQLGTERVGAAGEGGMNVFLGVAKGYDYGSEYDYSPSVQDAIKRGDLTNDEVALVSVVNNETAVKGLGSWMVLKGLEEGVTVLDAFDVKSVADSAGKLPKIYGTLGFQEVARVPFDAQYLTPAHIAAWEADGWTEDMGLPDIVVMKWKGSEDARANATRQFVLKGQASLGLGSLQVSPEHATSSGRILKLDGDGREGSRGTGEGDGSNDPSQFENRARGVSNRGRAFIEGVLRADQVATDALKLPKERVAAIEKLYDGILDEAPLPMEQRKQDKARGQFTPSSQIVDQNGDPMNLIQIFESGDRTTFLHESGHFWLEQLKQDAARFGGQLDKDFRVVTQWWSDNVDSIRAEAMDRAKRRGDSAALNALANMSDAAFKAHIKSGDLEGSGHTRYISVSMHEQWARGTEDYFSSGEAPSVGMADMFAAFSAWITSTYKTMKKRTGRDGLDVKFSPEVKGVMDRLLASDTEIDLVAAQYEVASMFSSAEEAGMTKSAYANYQRNIGRTKANAKAKQVAKRTKEQERQRLKYWKEEIEAMRSEVEQEVAQRPAHKLVWTLAEGGLADGSSADVPMDRVSTSSLLETISQLDLERLPKAGNKVIYSNSKKSGETANATLVAQAFGYDDAKAMTDDLLATPSFKDAVTQEIDRKMEEKHGKLEDNAYEAAIASIHNTSDMAKHIATELAAIRTTEAAINAKFVKATAMARIGKMAVKDLKPQKFLSMEKKHGKAAGVAFRKGDRVEAHKHKFQQLVNHYMAAEAIRRQKWLDTSKEYLRPFKSKSKKHPSIDADYVDRIKILLDGVTFGSPLTKRARLLAELRALNDWIEEKQKDDGAVLDISPSTLAREAETNYRDMSLNDFEALVNDIKMIERQGRLKKKLLRGVEERDRAQVVSELLDKLQNRTTARNAKAVKKRADSRNADGNTPFAASIAYADSSLVKVEFLLEELDGEIMGPWHQHLYQPFADAEDVKNQMNKDATDLIYKQLKKLYKGEKFNLSTKVDMGVMQGINGEPKQEWTRGMLIMLVLNTGNDSNLDKLIRGEKERGRTISEELINDATQQLTKKEMDFVQSIWSHSETLWPEVDRINRHEYGTSPDRVVPREVVTKHGTYKGGYYPMRYDPTIEKGANIEQLDALKAFQSENIRASLNSSMTKGRTAFAAPVDFDIGKLVGTFERTTHLISHYQAVRNAQRLLADKTLRAALSDVVGMPYVAELDSWLGAIASNGQDRPPLSAPEAISQTIANVTTVAILGASYTTIVSQPLGLLTGYDRLLADTTYGPVNATLAAKDMAVGAMMSLNPYHVKAVRGLSAGMRFRMDTMDRDLRSARRALRAKSGIIPRVSEFSMVLIGAMQFFVVDMPTWTAAFNRALRAEPGNQKKAIMYADRVVRISQTSGSIKDLSAIQRHKGYGKILVIFHSYFSLLYSVIRQRGRSMKLRNPSTMINFMVSMLIVLTATAFAEALMKRQQIPDFDPDDEDEQGMLAWAAQRSLNTASMSIPVIGSMADIAIGKLSGSDGPSFGFSLSPVDMFGETVSEGLGSTADLLHFAWDEAFDNEQSVEVDMNTANDIAAMVLMLKRLPTIQAKRFVDALIAHSEEAEDWSLMDLLTGYDEDHADHQE